MFMYIMKPRIEAPPPHRLVSVQIILTPGLYPGRDVYAAPNSVAVSGYSTAAVK